MISIEQRSEMSSLLSRNVSLVPRPTGSFSESTLTSLLRKARKQKPHSKPALGPVMDDEMTRYLDGSKLNPSIYIMAISMSMSTAIPPLDTNFI
ncbi:hypothetical protein ACN38_g5400 [Penicillium nordicum]|uniref:Uncharacterized protein n=1 Tax=Penicillium nordicum TaxID=229535 RepID=A0A0M8P8X7_9EURO|nr:hypothetical protein ACN38_g5400 [Penicillium nordicum]